MTDANIWKISLPAAAPRSSPNVNSDMSPAAEATAERLKAENDLSRWLPAGDLAEMKDRDVAVLSGETVALMSSATRDRSLWKAFPATGSVPIAQDLADRFRASLLQEKASGEAARRVCEDMGLDWREPALPNVEAAEKTIIRYGVAAGELSRFGGAVRTWLGIEPTLRDAAFLTAIAASLRTSDIAAMGSFAGSRPEIEQAVHGLDEIDRLASELSSEFGFDPSQHSTNAFGGIIRAFSSGRAQDFISAARKLGIAIKGADQAQRAAGLLKKYIAALEDMTGSPAGANAEHNAAIVAKARLAQSIWRRTEILSIDLSSLTPPLADIELLDFSGYPGDEAFSTNPDTRKLIEDNVAAAPGAAISDLASELNRQADRIGQWTERQRRGLLFAEPGSTHSEVELILAKNPVPMEAEGGLVIKGGDDLEALERHIQWLSEAAMLPLSDEQLVRFVGHVAGLKT